MFAASTRVARDFGNSIIQPLTLITTSSLAARPAHSVHISRHFLDSCSVIISDWLINVVSGFSLVRFLNPLQPQASTLLLPTISPGQSLLWALYFHLWSTVRERVGNWAMRYSACRVIPPQCSCHIQPDESQLSANFGGNMGAFTAIICHSQLLQYITDIRHEQMLQGISIMTKCRRSPILELDSGS